MKFTQATLLETPRRKNEGWTTYQARKLAGVSIRRVNQVWQSYLATGDVPVGGPKTCGAAYDPPGRASYRDNIADWNRRHDEKFSLLEITPLAYWKAEQARRP